MRWKSLGGFRSTKMMVETCTRMMEIWCGHRCHMLKLGIIFFFSQGSDRYLSSFLFHFSSNLILSLPPRQFDGGNNLAERPRKMARPSTAGPTSSSPSGAWRSGSAPRSNRLGNDETSSIGRGENDALQSRTATSNRQGMSLGSLLDGRGLGLASDSADAERYNTKSENRSSQMQQQLGRGQPLETTHGQQFRNSSVSGQQQSFTPQIPGYAPSPLGPGQGPQRPMNTSKVERPLTPSTLFLQNAIQSQNFSRQNPQQIRQEQQVRNPIRNCVCATAFNGCGECTCHWLYPISTTMWRDHILGQDIVQDRGVIKDPLRHNCNKGTYRFVWRRNIWKLRCTAVTIRYGTDFDSISYDFSETFNHTNSTVPFEEPTSSCWGEHASSAHSWYAFVRNDSRQGYAANVIGQSEDQSL